MEENSREMLARYRAGDSAAAEAIFQRYTERLLALARSRLSAQLARRVDADDVVQSTYRSFFTRARAGQFAVEREGDLWRLLATITLHKLRRQATRQRAAKRALDRELSGAEFAGGWAEVADREPSPADVAAATEEVHWLMTRLEPIKRRALQLRLQAHTLEEIAALLDRSERTVRRWLAEARTLLIERWAECADVEPENSSPNAAGDDVAVLRHADYRLERLIGSGGMCKVYAAARKRDGRRVAVKVLRKRMRRRREMVARFVNEARLVVRLAHPHIVPAHGLGRLPDGGYFMVLDYIDGGDLARICARGALPPARAIEIASAVADAIHYAHERGVIHRDLKPGNVLVNRAGKVFVTDFGFACLRRDAPAEDGAIVGTASFMAPEQFDARWGALGPQTDVYGLGALLFMLLTGRPPFAGATTSEILERVAAPRDAGGFQFPRGVPPALRRVCEQCLRQTATARFATARAAAIALRRAV